MVAFCYVLVYSDHSIQQQSKNMTSPYPQGCDNRSSNADPRSPFFQFYTCNDCQLIENDCECDSPELIALREFGIRTEERIEILRDLTQGDNSNDLDNESWLELRSATRRLHSKLTEINAEIRQLEAV